MTAAPPRLTATYRVQHNAAFTFTDARAIVPYLARLGVSHVYTSPILAARRGSMHGYDVVDPTRVNPELGSEDDLRALSADLRAHDMGLIVDIVPNHMGIGAENPFWDDVLARGERSRWAHWFDIDWARGAGPDGRRRVVLPVIGDELDCVIEHNELTMRMGADGKARLAYCGQTFPIDPHTMPPELQLAELDPHVIVEAAALFSGVEGGDRLRDLVAAQHYRLAGWKNHSDEINYRHFFDVVDLAAVRVEDPIVFDEMHALILRLIDDGVVHGLRIDHVDGLCDPLGYLTRLRQRLPEDAHLFVEKILAPGEELRESWPVDGTTGYEFSNAVEDALLAPDGFARIERAYRRMRRLPSGGFGEVARTGKVAVLQGALRGDVDRLVTLLAPLAFERAPGLARESLTAGVIELVASLPVYRTYFDDDGGVHEADRAAVEGAAADARGSSAAEAVRFMADLLLGRIETADRARVRQFIQRLQQLSGPAAAKGVEDTALYVYVPLASRNEVGGAPDRSLADAPCALHEANAMQASRWPVGLISTMTHDSKRSADVRARLDALTEFPLDWERTVRRWRRLNAKHRPTVRGRLAPDTNTEYLLYQTLVALWPAPRPGRRIDDLPGRAWRDALAERLVRYMLKAARESKTNTSWSDPDPEYEEALSLFVCAVLAPADDAPFLVDVARLVARVAPVGAWNALSRVVVHLTSPGTPDIYQGDELPNFVLVDPDNRQPVDYDARCAALDGVAGAECAPTLDPSDPRLKLWIAHRLLTARRQHTDLFARGSYRPLSARGARAGHVIAFARAHGDQVALTIAPRLISGLVQCDVPAESWWGDTAVPVTEELARLTWRPVLGGDPVSGELLPLATVLSRMPVGVWLGG